MYAMVFLHIMPRDTNARDQKKGCANWCSTNITKKRSSTNITKAKMKFYKQHQKMYHISQKQHVFRDFSIFFF